MFISADIGGTRTRVSSSKNLQNIHKVKRFKTPQTFNELKLAILENIVDVSDGQNINGICIGIPGVLNHKTGSIKYATNIPYLENKAFDAFFVDEDLISKVYFENDAYLAGLAESIVGSGKDYKNVAYVTLSTGIGGALIQNKDLPKTPKSYEPGHMIIDYNSKTRDNLDIPGSIETLLGGSFFEKNYGVKPEDTNDQAVWTHYGEVLAKALVNLIVMWSPDVIVLGGSISNKYEHFYPTLKKEITAFEFINVPHIAKSQLMDDAGIIGGLFYLAKTLS